ncbi:hypothetical protein HOT94_gp104 [Gordonia phage Phistory]|uniref:Uncharacterized protein n=1 Tax=Gordonia phage Phistory TaxID=2301694 RepID=A0A385E258_9CAUD|nr:hypothetical protein HOT94_gp104 [Gordonia phage Phistory]AXQ64809.1 hypothetical protein SEA_PHISTORY_104 [Gordonia phage Phistory]
MSERDELRHKVDAILAVAHDDEDAHGREDDLLRELGDKYFPLWVTNELNRLEGAFDRWCA